MIQRVQTIYMLASVIAILTMHLFWLGMFAMPEATFELNSLGLVSTSPGFETDNMCWDVFILLLVMVALPLIIIFLYQKRKLQLRMLIYTAIINLGYYALFFWRVTQVKADIIAITGNTSLEVTYNYMMLAMPALSIFCLVMAMRGVIYDIALLKSLDRLR